MMLHSHEVFRVIWPVRERPDGGYDQAEVDGFTVHSLWPAPPDPVTIEGIQKGMNGDWPERHMYEMRASVVEAPEYVDVIFDVRVWQWPDDQTWFSILERWLRRIVDAAASVAWVAPEGSFSWPDVFTPGSKVYAAYSSETGFLVGTGRGAAVGFVLDEDALRLQKLVTPVEERR